jgi:hypothetical protein
MRLRGTRIVGRGGAISATPTVADQSFDMGALTASGAGGWTPVNSGTAITSASITSGDASGHWTISSNGTLTPSAAGDAANMSSGTYTLVCSYNSGAVTATHTARCTGTDSNGVNLARSFSVKDATEMTTAAGNAVTSSASYPVFILARSGTYNLPSNTFQNRAFNANGCTLTRHQADSRASVYFTEPSSGSAAIEVNNTDNLTISGVKIALDGVSGVQNCIQYRNGSLNLTVTGCDIGRTTVLDKKVWTPSQPTTVNGIMGVAPVSDTLTVTNNYFHDLWNHIEMACSNALTITGNLFERSWEDSCQLGYSLSGVNPSIVFQDNTIIDTVVDTGAHCDLLQIIGNRRLFAASNPLVRAANVVTCTLSAASMATGMIIGSVVDVYVDGTSTFEGTFTLTGVAGAVLTWAQVGADETLVSPPGGRGVALSTDVDFSIDIQRNIFLQTNTFGNGAQCIFATEMTGGRAYTGIIRNNAISNGFYFQWGIQVQTVKNLEVSWNTVIREYFDATFDGPTVFLGSAGNFGGLVVQNNVTESALTITGAYTGSNNVEVGTLFSLIPFTTAFAGAAYMPLSRADVLSQMALKTGGPLDLTVKVGAVGNGYITWPATSPGGGGSFTPPSTGSPAVILTTTGN